MGKFDTGGHCKFKKSRNRVYYVNQEIVQFSLNPIVQLISVNAVGQIQVRISTAIHAPLYNQQP